MRNSYCVNADLTEAIPSTDLREKVLGSNGIFINCTLATVNFNRYR